jgi:hypothetical protein
MRARGQGLLTLAVIGAVALGAVSFDRLGERTANAPAPGTAASMSWLCPHGGGKGYEGTVFLANPGGVDVTARVTEVSAQGQPDVSEVQVSGGSQVAVDVDASARSSSTFVETFGGWLAAGWLIRGAEGEPGVGAEPCAPGAGRTWVSAAPTTGQGNDSYLIVMNPFAADAVFDVALFTAERAPVRDSELTDVTLRPRRSTAIRLNTYAQGEEGLGVTVDVSSGRVAASTLVASDALGIGSVLASAEPSGRQLVLTTTGTGRSVLSVAVPTPTAAGGSGPTPAGGLGTTFAATLRSGDPPQPAGGLAERSQEPESAAAYPITTTGPSGIDVVVLEGAPIVAALRTPGVGRDGGATAGSFAPAASWVVTPGVAGTPARPGGLVLNPGGSSATVEVSTIPGSDGTAEATTVTVPPGAVVALPREFLDEVGAASLLVTATGSPVVALGASTSLGNEGLSLFGLVAGVPIPEPATP